MLGYPITIPSNLILYAIIPKSLPIKEILLGNDLPISLEIIPISPNQGDSPWLLSSTSRVYWHLHPWYYLDIIYCIVVVIFSLLGLDVLYV
jgi:hypothetical protein